MCGLAPHAHPAVNRIFKACATLTPLERPPEFAGKEFMTEQEAADFERRTLEEVNSGRRSSPKL